MATPLMYSRHLTKREVGYSSLHHATFNIHLTSDQILVLVCSPAITGSSSLPNRAESSSSLHLVSFLTPSLLTPPQSTPATTLSSLTRVMITSTSFTLFLRGLSFPDVSYKNKRFRCFASQSIYSHDISLSLDSLQSFLPLPFTDQRWL